MTVTTTPNVVRAAARDRRIVTFTVGNTSDDPVSGSLQFNLPPGFAVVPARPMFGPVQPGSSARVGVIIASSNPGRHTVPYRVSYRVGNSGKEVLTAALPLTVLTGATLQSVYEHPRPYYSIQAPGYTARADMVNGLHRFLADDDDNVRLNGTALFTLSDGRTELLSEQTAKAFTWTAGTPAHITANAQDRARWQAIYFNDRILIRMDPGWTQFEKAYFTVPGRWSSPQGAPRWKRIVALDGSGKEVDVQPKATAKVVAAELEFPGATWNLAFQFQPAQDVTFNGTELKFAIRALTRDNWQVGFCRPGALDHWRGRK
jgi:hypothetical protein